MRLEIKGVQFGYRSMPVLESVSLSAGEGEVLSLVGPNGSGKTTLLKCINRILKTKKGTVFVAGKDVSKVKAKELARFLGYVPQSTHNSFPLTVFDTVLLGRTPHVSFKVGERDKEIVFSVLTMMGLEEMAFRTFNELSGGEKQRVLLARSLAQEPQVLLLDEPTSNLDLKHQLETLDIIREVVKKKSLLAVMAIHDLNLASRFSDKIAMLKDGGIYAAGKSSEVFNPENIKEVYGVETRVLANDSGKPYIIPLAAVENGSGRFSGEEMGENKQKAG